MISRREKIELENRIMTRHEEYFISYRIFVERNA